MRLGQLARKLERTPTEIIEFLVSKGIAIDEGVNSKLDVSQVGAVIEHFAPDLKVSSINEPDEPIAESGISEKIEEKPAENLVEEKLQESDPSQPESTDVIRAPKVELAGLKVLGKIDLPEPKKKQDETPSETPGTETPREFKKDRRHSNANRSNRPAKNPIALKREQEAMEAQRKREEELRLQKERRTQNYLKKVKSHQPTKAARIIKEDAEQLSAAELREKPKTWWGKLFQWFTGHGQ
jgi:hypothetical protein